MTQDMDEQPEFPRTDPGCSHPSAVRPSVGGDPAARPVEQQEELGAVVGVGGRQSPRAGGDPVLHVDVGAVGCGVGRGAGPGRVRGPTVDGVRGVALGAAATGLGRGACRGGGGVGQSARRRQTVARIPTVRERMCILPLVVDSLRLCPRVCGAVARARSGPRGRPIPPCRRDRRAGAVPEPCRRWQDAPEPGNESASGGMLGRRDTW